MKNYSQIKAMLAIARASFRSILRSPSAVVFTLLFPLIFILVFGFINGGGLSLDVALDERSDTRNPVVSWCSPARHSMHSACSPSPE